MILGQREKIAEEIATLIKEIYPDEEKKRIILSDKPPYHRLGQTRRCYANN